MENIDISDANCVFLITPVEASGVSLFTFRHFLVPLLFNRGVK